MGKAIAVDGFEFEAERSDVSDIENLNYYLEKKFSKFDIKDYMSRRHPELFPRHIGLRSDESQGLKVVMWKYSYSSGYDAFEKGWDSNEAENKETYKADILKFYKDNDAFFYDFIKDRMV